jgi:hypothetical protein
MTGLTQERRLSRRAALGRAATVGVVAWSAPILLSTPAHATMSAGARTMRGPFRSLTLAWDPSGWQARPGTGRSPALKYFRTRQLDVNGGSGWKLIATGQAVDLHFGSPLQFKMPPLGGGPTGRQVAQTDTTVEPVTTEPVTTEPVTTEPVTTEPVTTEPVTTDSTDSVDEGTTTTTVAEAPATTVAATPSTTVAETPSAPVTTDAPEQAPTTTAAPEAPAATAPDTDDALQSMVIDMSAAATISIGDRFGFFTVVDGQTA